MYADGILLKRSSLSVWSRSPFQKKQNFISMLISKSETYLLDDHEHGIFSL